MNAILNKNGILVEVGKRYKIHSLTSDYNIITVAEIIDKDAVRIESGRDPFDTKSRWVDWIFEAIN